MTLSSYVFISNIWKTEKKGLLAQKNKSDGILKSQRLQFCIKREFDWRPYHPQCPVQVEALLNIFISFWYDYMCINWMNWGSFFRSNSLELIQKNSELSMNKWMKTIESNGFSPQHIFVLFILTVYVFYKLAYSNFLSLFHIFCLCFLPQMMFSKWCFHV